MIMFGIDGGLATSGLIVGRTDGVRHECIDVATFESHPQTEKLALVSADRERRTQELCDWLEPYFVFYKPELVAAEAMSMPRGSNPQICISLAWGVLVAVTRIRCVPRISALPMVWRKSLVRGGGEARAHKVAMKRIPSYVPLEARIPVSMRAHARDGLGVFLWGSSQPEARTA